MPFEVTRDVTMARVTPELCKGALGTWRALFIAPGRDTGPTNLGVVVVSSRRANLQLQGCMRASA